MSGGAIAVISAATSSTAIAVAAAAHRRMLAEEEKMTAYKSDDLEGWEFKIVRSNTSKFKKYEVVKQICDEEARAGWELVEKFDDNRLRFKRRVEKRANDQYLDVDPYRTQIGIGGGQIGALIAGAILLTVGVVLFVVMMFAR